MDCFRRNDVLSVLALGLPEAAGMDFANRYYSSNGSIRLVSSGFTDDDIMEKRVLSFGGAFMNLFIRPEWEKMMPLIRTNHEHLVAIDFSRTMVAEDVIFLNRHHIPFMARPRRCPTPETVTRLVAEAGNTALLMRFGEPGKETRERILKALVFLGRVAKEGKKGITFLEKNIVI